LGAAARRTNIHTGVQNPLDGIHPAGDVIEEMASDQQRWTAMKSMGSARPMIVICIFDGLH
jgi:hypothetical protein